MVSSLGACLLVKCDFHSSRALSGACLAFLETVEALLASLSVESQSPLPLSVLPMALALPLALAMAHAPAAPDLWHFAFFLAPLDEREPVELVKMVDSSLSCPVTVEPTDP